MTKQEFIEKIAAAVIKIAPEFGICVYSPVIAQACLESNYGTSTKGQKNNFFGLKYRENRVSCHSGTFVDGSAEQNPDGSYVSIVDQWYTFATIEDGVRGYFQFINTSRYQNLKGITDPLKYLQTIREDGYATSLKYVENVYNTLTSNNLQKYDKKEDQKQMSTFKVHIDPGHYGSKYNQSTTNKNYYESEMVWKLSNYLKAELEKLGITVTFSRSTQAANPALYDRGFGAKGCNLFLSMHSNACGTESVDYPVVYRGYDKDTANEFGLKLADLIANLMSTKQKGRTATRTGQNGEYYGVLRGARAAGLTYYYIVEHSFHTNGAATEWLLKDTNLKLLAKKEAELIASYFNVKITESTPTPAPVAPSQPASSELYRVRLSWKDTKSQIGAYSNFENAKKACKEGYTIFNSKGEAVYSNIKKEEPAPEFKPYTVKITADSLNVRKGPSTGYAIVTTIKKGEVYTIVSESNGWGKLKSGAGWISLAYTQKNGTSSGTAQVTTRTYVVKKGDSYWKIAAQQLGKGSRYPEIQKLNGNKALYAGMKILIPLK